MAERARAAPDAGAHPPLARLGRGARWALAIAWLVAGIALVWAQVLSQKVNNLQHQLARQAADAVKTSVEARTLAQRADDQAQAASAKLAALEGRVGDLVAYRDKMQDMVQAVLRARDENVAVDLDAALRLARDQSQLTGSVTPLLAALRTAERRLGQSNDPRLIPVARAVAHDLQRVRDVHTPDTAGLLTRVEQLSREVDTLPMRRDLDGIVPPGTAPAAPAVAPSSWWARLRGRICKALGLRQPAGAVDPGVLSPSQALLIRANLRLRLEGARIALLARQYGAARADFAASVQLLQTWFDVASPHTQAAIDLLGQLGTLAQAPDLPDAAETLTALNRVESPDSN